MTFARKLAAPALLTVLVLACGASGQKQEQPSSQQEGQAAPAAALRPAPDFSLEKVDGSGSLSLSELKGKVLIVDFWATWCPPCVQEIPDFIALYKTYKDQGFEMVGISVDKGGPSVVKAFMEKQGVNYPVVMATMEAVNAYEVFTGIPTTFVIDRQGNIVDKVIGLQSKDYFEAQIKKLL